MFDWYGSITDFILCCLFSISLFQPTKLKRLFAALAVFALLIALFGLGWDIIAKAFTESLSAINKNIGGVLFGAAVLAGMAIVEWFRDKRSGVVQKIFEIAGVGVFVAIGVWSLVFMYEAFIGVPVSIYRHAGRISPPTLVVGRMIPPSNWDEKSKPMPKPAPFLSATYAVMPYDPPYPPDTVIAGIKFRPGTFDVRFYLSINRAPIKNLDLQIHLINTSGQILSIQGLGQRTPFPGITIAQVGGSGHPQSIQVTDSNGQHSTVPMGATSSLGTLESFSDTWRIHSAELLADTTPEFVLMVSRPHRTKMIEGFIISGTYEYDVVGKVKTEKVWNMTKFDDLGKSYKPTLREVQTVLKYKRPGVHICGVQIDLTGKFPLLPPPGGPPADCK